MEPQNADKDEHKVFESLKIAVGKMQYGPLCDEDAEQYVKNMYPPHDDTPLDCDDTCYGFELDDDEED